MEAILLPDQDLAMDLLLDEFKSKLNHKVYFEYKSSCKIGTLIGLIKLDKYYWIIQESDLLYIPIEQSITLL